MSRVTEPQPPEHPKIWPRVAIALAGVMIAAFVTTTLLLVWPSAGFSYSHDGPMRVVSDEFTSTGEPVVRVGEDLELVISFCNEGVDAYTKRWADLWLPDDSSKDLIRVGAFEVPAIQSFNGATERVLGCLFDVEQPIGLPTYLDADRYYTFRLDTQWRVNFLRWDEAVTSSERFYLAGEDSPIP